MARINVYFACDAGMGSSALGASLFKRYVSCDIAVSNCSLYDIPQGCNVVIVQRALLPYVQKQYRFLKVYTIDNFLDEKKTPSLFQKEMTAMIENSNILAKEQLF